MVLSRCALPSAAFAFHKITTNSIISKQSYRMGEVSNILFPQLHHNRLYSSSDPSSQSVVSTPPLTDAPNNTQSNEVGGEEEEVPLYLAQGLFAVVKPLEWTSQDAVSFVRGMIERDARERGATVVKVGKRRGNKKQMVRVGHGGTLDPLATGVLVIGVGKGTKELQSYLTGAKKYRAGGKFGFQTTTLDLDPKGETVITKSYDHITYQSVQDILPSFTGTIMQKPPIFSAIKKNGKKLYELAREGNTDEDIKIKEREVEIHCLELLPDFEDDSGKDLPSFGLDVACGGGTYIRSLVRDIGEALGSAATMTSLSRTQQGPFVLDDALDREDWSVENIARAIDKSNAFFEELRNSESS